MRFSVFTKILTNNDRYKPDDQEYRHVCLLNVILVLFFIIGVLFSILNILKGYYTLTAAHAVAAVLCCLTFVYFHKTNRLTVCSYAVIAIMLAMLITASFDAGYSHYILIWSCACPPVVLFLLGKKKGLIVSGAIIVYMAVFMLLNYGNWGPSDFNSASVVNILGTLLTLTLLVTYFEMSRHEAAAIVAQKNRDLEKANDALRLSREELRHILDSTAEAIFGVDMEMRCTFTNTSCLEILGLKSEDELLGKDMHTFLHSRHRDGTPLPKSECDIVRTCMEGIPAHRDDEVFWRPGGVSFDVEYNSYPQYKNGEVIGAVVTFSDNTLKKMHEQQIEYYSSHDSLTGLLNRSYFEALLQRLDNKSSLPLSVIMGDLNGLKLMNDIFGHDAGDELLIKTAEVLKQVCRAEDLIARLGGDEFVILLPRTPSKDAQVIMDRIRSSLKRERVKAILCSMSLGCETKTTPLQSFDLTLKAAENEMYKEKTLNRGQVNVDMINAVIMTLYQRSPREELHAANVSELCKMIGEEMGLTAPEISQLRSAGFLHDIGNIGVDPEILLKQQPYNEEEAQLYKQHPVVGYRILNLFDHTLNLADSVYSHHERWDGEGFPRGLKGDEIPLMARIIAVAGVYDTILRGWLGDPLPKTEALRQLEKEAGTRLDPEIVRVFVAMMEKEETLDS